MFSYSCLYLSHTHRVTKMQLCRNAIYSYTSINNHIENDSTTIYRILAQVPDYEHMCCACTDTYKDECQRRNQHMHMYMHMPAFVRVYMPSKYRSEAAKASFYELVAICRAVRVCTCKWT